MPVDPVSPEASYRRRVRSFVTRAGRVSNAQRNALDTLLPVYGISWGSGMLDFAQLFGRTAPTVLEIGFGMGETTVAIAALRRDVNFLGVEVHTPGVGALLKQLAQEELGNVRLIQHDAIEVLEQMIPDATLAGVHIFFPDPWHKARHNKRRLINTAFAALIAQKLMPGGYLHCATDWQHYAEQMLEVLGRQEHLINTATGYALRANPLGVRPMTKFEVRGERLGHGVWDLLFARRDDEPVP